ncbi:siderophore-interacting protein [Steroidobacter flavus]|uniref:Siderophore-interacting protein n=1 Tax=Steroidobacter flavus TaxID=1842136 RepID=A0ABV8SY10_9GAMM
MSSTLQTSGASLSARLSKALRLMVMKSARVTEVAAVAERFRLVTLENPAFKELTWVPGQKLQVAMGSAFMARTFTPMEWDPAKGCTRILGYAHGNGPGSDWIRRVSVGDECDVFGPRSSLKLTESAPSLAVLGDETSIGLAYSLLHESPARMVRCLLEVSDVQSVRQVTTPLGLGDATLVRRRDDDSHVQEIAASLRPLATAGTAFVLTGRAHFIQGLRRALKDVGVSSSHLMTKPHWAPGRTGLD